MLFAVLLVAGLEFAQPAHCFTSSPRPVFRLRRPALPAIARRPVRPGLVFDQPLHAGREVAVYELDELLAAAFVQLADDGDVLDLLVGEFAVGAVDLGEDVPRIDEQDAVVGLGLVEEPERGRERDRVEHVRGQRQHAVDEVLLDQRAADVRFGMARVGRGIRHDQRGAALRLQRSGEEIDPKVIPVGNGFLALSAFLAFDLLRGMP